MPQKRATAHRRRAKKTAKNFMDKLRVKKVLSIFPLFLFRAWPLPSGKIAFGPIAAAVKDLTAPSPSFGQVAAAFWAFNINFFNNIFSVFTGRVAGTSQKSAKTAVLHNHGFAAFLANLGYFYFIFFGRLGILAFRIAGAGYKIAIASFPDN